MDVKETVSARANSQVHLNVPTVLWKAVKVMAAEAGTSMTNMVVRALGREAYFFKVRHDDPGARVWIERSDGERTEVVFL